VRHRVPLHFSWCLVPSSQDTGATNPQNVVKSLPVDMPKYPRGLEYSSAPL
jgi:hypothetical protein